MFRHLLLSAFRHYKSNKLNLLINMVGLTLGLSATILISSYIIFELGFDRHNVNKNRIYRIVDYKADVQWAEPKAPYILGEYIIQDIREVESVVRIGYLPYAQIRIDKDLERTRLFRTADPSVFNIFSFTFLEGTPQNALKDHQSVVLSKSMADQYFPDGNAYGSTIEVINRKDVFVLTITGIIEDLPAKSSLQANFIGHIELSLKGYEQEQWSSNVRTDWYNDFFNLFILGEKGVGQEILESRITELVDTYKDPVIKQEYSLQKLTKVHLFSDYLVNAGRTGNIKQIYLLLAVGTGILIIACFNYIILSIAQSAMRTKEIGVRKVFGGTRKQIRNQILGESILLSLISFPVALGLAEVSQTKIKQLFLVDFPSPLNDPVTLLVVVLITILVGFISGGYIAFYLSKLNPVLVFRHKLARGQSKYLFQKILITLQIFIFVSLLSGTQMIHKQIQLGQKKDLGFDHENLARVYLGRRQLTNIYDIFKDELLQNTSVIAVSGGMVLPPTNSKMVSTIPGLDDPERVISIEGMVADFDIIVALGLNLLEGRTFSKKFVTDSNTMIINETAAKALGNNNPVGERINNKEIIGIIQDFHLHSLHEKVAPLEISISDPKYVSDMLIRYQPGQFQRAQEHVKNVWEKYAGEAYFEMIDFQEAIGSLYTNEKRIARITSIFGGLAILIATFGLFGLSMFTARQRTHEIGIRKALGAFSIDILKMYARDFLILVVLANLLSIPLSVYLMNKWLSNFAYQTGIQADTFLLTFIFSVVIVLLTIIYYAQRLASVNPAHTLRYE